MQKTYGEKRMIYLSDLLDLNPERSFNQLTIRLNKS